VLRLSPGYVNAHATIGEVLLQKGDAQGALAEIQQETNAKVRLSSLSAAYHALGRKVESDAALAELIRKYEQTSAYDIAIALAYRGEADRAFEWLDKAVQYDDPNLGSLAVYPLFTNLHSDPRWLPFLRKVGIAPEQLAAIQFDVTLPK
jgi:tetratricopeptide (TPR) repeat protein